MDIWWVIPIIAAIILSAVGYQLYHYYKRRKKKEQISLVKANISVKKTSKEILQEHFLTKNEYEDNLRELELVLSLPNSLVPAQDILMLTLTLSDDPAVRILATKFFEISDEIKNIIATGLVPEFNDCESMLDSLREKCIGLINGSDSIEDVISEIQKLEENKNLLLQIAMDRSEGQHSHFRKLELESWNELLVHTLGQVRDKKNQHIVTK